jgi:TolB-like protein/Flp pilus assembly protein TadD
LAEQLDRLRAALADRYAIERELGRGGMATVYLAEDLKHHRNVAIKVLHPELAAALGPERFLREIETAAQLQHPHILPLHDSGQADDFLYYVMPFVKGESLREKLVRERELPVAEATRILRDVADALAHAHEAGVVHRDIKPENILLSGRHALVTDFGVAKAISEATGRQQLTTAGMAIGTPAYMAPEQAVADPQTDHRADIYSLGVVAYEMLTGDPPFGGSSPQAILSAHVIRAPVAVAEQREVPAPLGELVMKCLKKKPADRWQRADEVLHQLEALMTPSAGTTPAASVPMAATARPNSPVRLAILTAGVVALLAIGYGGFTGRLRPGKSSEGPKIPTIAVLPFDNMGATEDQYFADGMTEELTSRLARVSGLAVIARTSANQYRASTKPISQIGRELGADYLIEGAVRWEKTPGASRVRITPKLIRVRDGRNVWTEPYEEPYGTKIFDMQAAIAEKVAGALSVTLLAPERKAVGAVPTRNLEAYDYFLRGQAYTAKDLMQDWDAMRLALEMYRKAVALDPGFALAHAWEARTQVRMGTHGFDVSQSSGITAMERQEVGRQAARRALVLDPDLPLARLTLATLAQLVGDTATERQELDRVIQANPSDPQALPIRGEALIRRGRVAEGLASIDKAATLDPLNAQLLMSGFISLASAGYHQAVERYTDRALALTPDDPSLHVGKAWLKVLEGRLEEARAAMHEGVRRSGSNTVLFTVAKHSYWILLLRILGDEFGDATKGLSWGIFGADSGDYYLAKAIVHGSSTREGRAYHDSLAAWARAHAEQEGGPQVRIILAIGLAGSGHRDAAIKEIDRLRANQNPRWGELNHEYLAEACVRLGQYQCALDQLDSSMARPGYLSRNLLKLDPIWDPIRENPRFKKLVEGN